MTMEKAAEREREAEPIVYRRSHEETWSRVESEKAKLASLPHVVKFSQIPWEQTAQAYAKGYNGLGVQGRLEGPLPIVTMAIREQIVSPSSRSGKHRHYMEALFYIVEGEGYAVHDEKKYPWEEGDIFCVPTYCVHQRFNSLSGKQARLFFSIPNVYELMGLASIEQLEFHPNYQPPPGATMLHNAEGKLIGYRTASGAELRFMEVNKQLQELMATKARFQFDQEPQDNYERYLKTLTEQTRWRQTVPHVIKGKEIPWENTRMGKLKFYITPYKPSPLYLYDAYVQELPPGGSSGKHRHVGEEVHKILEGKGYDIHDGVRWDWEKEDVVAIPNNTVHQHFNADPHRPARFFSLMSRLYYNVGHGGIEHMEAAPDYAAGKKAS